MVSGTYSKRNFELTSYETPWLYTTSTTATTDIDISPTTYYTSTTSSEWDSITIIITSKETDDQIKKRLKKMMDKWCMDGWIQHIPSYIMPKFVPISLRGVRLEGRGWGNKK